MLHPVSVQERKTTPRAPWGGTGDLTQDQDILHARQATLQMRYIPRSTYSFVLFKNLFKKFTLEFQITHIVLSGKIFIYFSFCHPSLFIFFLEVDVQISGNMYSSMILLFRRVFLLMYLKIDYFHAAFYWLWQIVR